MSIKVIDNFLSPNQFEEVQEYFLNYSFPWFINTAVNGNQTVEEKYNWQMFNLLYHTPNVVSEHMPALSHILSTINPCIFLKAKINCNFVTERIIEHGLHTDMELERKDIVDKITTAVYYLNTNDGYTVFEDGTKVESLANRLVTFPATMMHSGSSCTNKQRRIVINLNYIDKT